MKILHRILAAAILLFLCSCTEKQEQKQIGLQLYSIRAQMAKNMDTTLDAVAAAGYSFVELAGYNHKEGIFYGLPGQDFIRLCHSRGLEVLSSHINGPDPNTIPWEACLSWWDKAIEDHAQAEIKYLVQPSMHKTAYTSLEGLLQYCRLFNEVGEKCNNAGIRFGYHNHDKEFSTLFDGIPIYDHMLLHTNPDNVFFQIDVFWSLVGGFPAQEYMEKYPGRFELWHVKDDKEIGASGTIDFESLYKRARIAGLKYAIVEQEAFDLEPFESIKASYDFLNNAPYVKPSYAPVP